MKTAIAEVIATGFYSGYAPKAPGTFGTAVGLLLVLVVNRFLYFINWHIGLLTLVCLLPSLWATQVMIKESKEKDPQFVVIDEVLGLWVAFIAVTNFANPVSYLAAFGFFRLFDIWKPFPVRLFEKLPGAVGVIADDLVAGLYAALCIYILRNFLDVNV
jgi:phosphatidylglycerophosphatase A